MSSSGYLLVGRALPVPRLVAEEGVVLRVDAERRRRTARTSQSAARVHSVDLVVGDAGGGDERARASRDGADRSHVDDVGRESQREPRHHVGVDVVVDHRRVLVGAGDAVDVEARRVGAVVEAEVGEQPRHLDEHLGTLAAEELGVAGGRDVAVDGVGDVGVDVVLGGARRVVRRRLLAVDRAPRVQRPALRHLRSPGGVRRAACGGGSWSRSRAAAGLLYGEQRDHVDLGVPEVVAVVAADAVTALAAMPRPPTWADACAIWNRFQRIACWAASSPSTAMSVRCPEPVEPAPAARRAPAPSRPRTAPSSVPRQRAASSSIETSVGARGSGRRLW